MGFSSWVTRVQQDLAAGTCFGGTTWDGSMQFPKEGWGILVEQPTPAFLAVPVLSWTGNPLGVSSLGPTDPR